MKNPIPQEIIQLYGTVAVSRIARKKTILTLEQMPKIQQILKQSPSIKKAQVQSIEDLDVENGGMSDEFGDFMRDGFLCLIPDEFCPDPDKWKIPDLPPAALICAQIRQAADSLLEEYAVQSQAVQQLRPLVAALGTNKHPLIILFTAIFKAALQQAEERLAELSQQFAALVQAAQDNDCPYPVFTL